MINGIRLKVCGITSLVDADEMLLQALQKGQLVGIGLDIHAHPRRRREHDLV